MKEKIYEIINTAIKDCSKKEDYSIFVNLINIPWGFNKSNPNKFGKESPKNSGETKYQRFIFQEESDVWLDMELPVGQNRNDSKSRWCSKRIDLIGKKDGKYILCELKVEGGDNPLKAILQILAYYLMIKQNCQILDKSNVYHKGSDGTLRNPERFKWSEVAEQPILHIRAPKQYWARWEKSSNQKEKDAFNIILKECRAIGLEISIIKDEWKLISTEE